MQGWVGVGMHVGWGVEWGCKCGVGMWEWFGDAIVGGMVCRCAVGLVCTLGGNASVGGVGVWVGVCMHVGWGCGSS